jgi:hypothetical protein
MTPTDLRILGESLYGPRWQTKLARALPVNPRTVRRWLSGEIKMRSVVAERIKSLAAQRGCPHSSPSAGIR